MSTNIRAHPYSVANPLLGDPATLSSIYGRYYNEESFNAETDPEARRQLFSRPPANRIATRHTTPTPAAMKTDQSFPGAKIFLARPTDT